MAGYDHILFFGDVRLLDDDVVIDDKLKQLMDTSCYNVVNFEAPIVSDAQPIQKSGPNLSQNVLSVEWLKRNGVNVVSLANNHAMDFGRSGLDLTIKSFKDVHLIGAGEKSVAYQPLRLQLKNGKILTILAGTHTEFGTLRDGAPEQDYGCANITSCHIANTIIKEREISDYIVVYAHAGVEYMDVPLPEWRSVYRSFIDLGCDAVIASHPHVPQGVETYQGKKICYSLGNFCFQTTNNNKPYWNYSLGAMLTINESGLEVEMIPLKYDVENHVIAICDEPEYLEHVSYLNDILLDDSKYIKEVNLIVDKLLSSYNGLFSRSGYNLNIFKLGFVKGILEAFKTRRLLSKTHVLNNLQCESHRWAITRALRNRHNIE